MNCNEINTSNNNGSNNAVPIIKHVYGNVLRMAIPLTKRVVTMEDGEVVATDENFIPSSNYPVSVQFVKDAIKIDIPAIMMGNVAVIEDKGTLPVGTYSIVVLCKDDEGNPYRFKQRAIARVYDVTADADIQQPIEFETRLWYLDAAIFLALQGKDGVGISETIIEESDEVGGYNIITFVFTDGTTRTFSVMNGSGAVDTIFSTTSQHPLANSVVTQRFNTIEQNLNDASDDIDNLKENSVGVVEFNENTKRLVGHPVDSESENDPIFSIDFTDFLKNYFISSGFIENGVLKLRYNTEANKQDLEIDLNEHINPIEYLTKLEASQTYVLSQELEDYIKLNAAGKINYTYMPFVVLSSMNLAYNGNPTASLVGTAHYCTDGYVRYFYRYNSMINSIRATPVAGVLYCLKTTGDLYYWDAANRVFVVANKNVDAYTKAQINTLLQDYVGSEQYSEDIAIINEALQQLVNFTEKGEDGRLNQNLSTAVVLNGFDGDTYSSSYGYFYDQTTRTITWTYSQGQASHWKNIGEPDDRLIYYNISRGKFYRYDTTNGMVEISTGSGGGSFTQVQADWNQTNTSAVDYIKNKPTIPDVSGFATTNDIDSAIAALVSSAPQTLDTLRELADALGNDPNFATTITTQLGNKVDKVNGKGLSTEDYTSAEKSKLSGIASGAEINVQSDWNESDSSSDAYIKNKPTIPAAQVQSDWNAASGMGVILNKPNLSQVATSGSYNDLSNKPTIPTIPTNVSSFTNDAGYLTAHQDISGKADKVMVVDVASTGDVSQALAPNTFYKFGSIDSLALTLTAGTGFVMYAGKFTASADWGGTELSVPANVTEATGNDTVEAGKVYEFSILDNVISVKEVA